MMVKIIATNIVIIFALGLALSTLTRGKESSECGNFAFVIAAVFLLSIAALPVNLIVSIWIK